jgi:hypothetical protein
MGPEEKMTKQGVRDLNHLNPKRRPVPVEPEEAVIAAVAPASPAPALAVGVALPPIGK